MSSTKAVCFRPTPLLPSRPSHTTPAPIAFVPTLCSPTPPVPVSHTTPLSPLPSHAQTHSKKKQRPSHTNTNYFNHARRPPQPQWGGQPDLVQGHGGAHERTTRRNPTAATSRCQQHQQQGSPEALRFCRRAQPPPTASAAPQQQAILSVLASGSPGAGFY